MKNLLVNFVEKFKNERKFKIITLTTIVSIVALTTVGVVSYNDYKAKEAEKQIVAEYKENINKEYTTFSKEEDRAKKLEELKILIKEYNSYKDLKTVIDLVKFLSVSDLRISQF